MSTVIAISLYTLAGALLLSYLTGVYAKCKVIQARTNEKMSVDILWVPLTLWVLVTAATAVLLLF